MMNIKLEEDAFWFCQNVKRLRKIHSLSRAEMAKNKNIKKGASENRKGSNTRFRYRRVVVLDPKLF